MQKVFFSVSPFHIVTCEPFTLRLIWYLANKTRKALEQEIDSNHLLKKKFKKIWTGMVIILKYTENALIEFNYCDFVVSWTKKTTNLLNEVIKQPSRKYQLSIRTQKLLFIIWLIYSWEFFSRERISWPNEP